MDQKKELTKFSVGNTSVAQHILILRDKQVMLDRDLAKLYRCANGTKTINQAVKRNIDRFPNDFYFQLTRQEYENLKFHFGTSSFHIPFVIIENKNHLETYQCFF